MLQLLSFDAPTTKLRQNSRSVGGLSEKESSENSEHSKIEPVVSCGAVDSLDAATSINALSRIFC
jgi:hypothetical protein